MKSTRAPAIDVNDAAAALSLLAAVSTDPYAGRWPIELACPSCAGAVRAWVETTENGVVVVLHTTECFVAGCRYPESGLRNAAIVELWRRECGEAA